MEASLHLYWEKRYLNGERNSYSLMKAKAFQLLGDSAEELGFQGGRSWWKGFMGRWKLSKRVGTNNKSDSLINRLPNLTRYLVGVKLLLQRRAQKGVEVPLNRRMNVDQTGFMFGGNNSTIAPIGSRSVYIKSKNGTNSGKRFCTAMLCISADGCMLKTAIIFTGQGLVFKKEKNLYDKDVDVYFTKNSWADGAFMLEWAKNTFLPASPEGFKLLFMDNFSAHKQPEFTSYLREKCDTLPWFIILFILVMTEYVRVLCGI